MNKIINVSIDINISANRAFEMFTNSDSIESWLCGKAIIDPKIGGKYETYNEHDKDDNTEGCKVLAIDNGKYIAMEWKGPKQFAELMNVESELTQVSVLFHPKGKLTQVTVLHSGWKLGSEEAITYFQKAWEGALKNLQTTLASKEEVTQIGVTGLGGTFFKSKDPEKLKEWYDEHLGFETDQYGKAFRWVQWGNTQKSGSTQWSVMPEDTKYFAPSEKPYMLNYRVGDLVALLGKMKAAGVKIAGEMEEYDYGKFGWVVDPEGNKIELWEPVDEVFDEYYDK